MSTVELAQRHDAHDLRLGGRWTRGQNIKNEIIYRALRAAVAVADRMPRRTLLAIGRVAGRLAHLVLRRERDLARNNVRATLGAGRANEIVKECFVNAGENLMLTMLLRRPCLRALDVVEVDDESRRALAGALALGRGAVMVGAHLGPFELMAATVAELGHRPAVVVRESYDPRLDALVDHHRTDRGVEVLARGGRGSSRRIVRALREGRPVGFLSDLGGRVRSSAVELLGVTASIAAGPQVLACRLGAPVVFGALSPMPRQRGIPRFRLEIQRLTADVEPALTRCVATAMSRAIAESPGHWLWMARSLASGDCRGLALTDKLPDRC